MSNSSSDHSFQLMKEDQKEIHSENSSPPISDSSDGCPKIFSNQNLDQIQANLQEQQGSSNTSILEDQEKKSDGVIHQILETTKSGKPEVEDDDEGFRTPTSLDQRIPSIPEKCPPAPRKSRPPSPPPCSRKRKFSRRRNNIVMLDFSTEIESFFPTIIREDIGKKMKKCPKGDDHDDANK